MKNRRYPLILLCLLLLGLVLAGAVAAAEAESDPSDSLPLLNVRIPVPEGASASLEGSEYYIYAGEKGSIPYVMLKTYQSEDAVAFLQSFTAYMREQYTDLKVTAEIHPVTIGTHSCYEADYSYQISGYDVTDRRVVLVLDGTAYLFSSKEVESLGMTVDGMLEDIIESCIFLSEEESKQESGLADGYMVCLENGMPRFWLDFTGTVSDQLVLHCCASSGDPTTFEQCLALDISTANITQDGILIHHIRDLEGNDLSDRFKSLTLQIFLDGILMTSELEDGASADPLNAILPAGSLAMSPVGVARDPEGKTSHLRPLTDGPYLPEELAAWARIYDFRVTGTYRAGSEAVENPDGTFHIYLYEAAEGTPGVRKDSDLRYQVDAYGEGTDVRIGAPVSLMR